MYLAKSCANYIIRAKAERNDHERSNKGVAGPNEKCPRMFELSCWAREGGIGTEAYNRLQCEVLFIRCRSRAKLLLPPRAVQSRALKVGRPIPSHP